MQGLSVDGRRRRYSNDAGESRIRYFKVVRFAMLLIERFR
jgi:hypothetical protein